MTTELLAEAREAMTVLAAVDDEHNVKRYQLPKAASENPRAVEALDTLELWMRTYLDRHAEEGVFSGNAVDALKELVPDEEADKLYRLRGQLISRMREAGMVESTDTGLRLKWTPAREDATSLHELLYRAIERADVLESENAALVSEVTHLRTTLHRVAELVVEAMRGPNPEEGDEEE